jgi:hypothetical protein
MYKTSLDRLHRLLRDEEAGVVVGAKDKERMGG